MVRFGPPLPGDTLITVDPVIVVEVASPSTQRADALLKLTRYFRNVSIQHYLIVMPNQRSLLHHRRGDGGRIETTVHVAGHVRLDPPGLDLCLETRLLPSIGSSI